jgi:hypothetical protein
VDSNFITPPDFVDNQLHTVTLIDASQDDVELLVRMCEHTDEPYNIYLYRSEMNNDVWLAQALKCSDAVIVNIVSRQHNNICLLDNAFYYGSTYFLENPRKLDGPLHYFAARVEN